MGWGKKDKLDASKAPESKQQAKDTFFKLSTEQKANLERSVLRLQKRWHQKTKIDTLIPVNPNGVHGPAVAHLINSQITIEKNIHREKRKNLLQALQNNLWCDPVFEDKYILQIAMAAFVNEEINYQQMETIIRFHSASWLSNDDRRQVTPHAILDVDGTYTQIAKKLLFPALSKFMQTNVTSETHAKFKQILMYFLHNAPSENMFYSYPKTKFKQHELEVQLAMFQSVLYANERPLVLHLSASAHDAFRLAVFGFESISARMMLGKLTPTDIEQAVMKGYRPQGGFFPKTNSKIREVHGIKNVDPITLGDHDHYHADLMSRLGTLLNKALNECIISIRQDLLTLTDHTNASAIWSLADRELSLYNTSTFSNTETAKAFSVALFRERYRNFLNPPNCLAHGDKLSDAGLVCMIDMATRKEHWVKNLNFHPQNMTGIFKEGFEIAEKIHPFLKVSESTWNILIFRAYLTLNNHAIFLLWEPLLRQKYEENKARFSCKRTNKIQFLGVIDNELKKQPLEHIILNTLMSFLNININENIPTANVDRALALTNAYLLIKSTAGNRRYIRDSVLTPLRDILTNMAEKFNPDTLRKPQADMSRFLNHHQQLANKSLTAQSPTSPLLSEDDINKLSLALEFISKGFVNPKPPGMLDLIFKTMSHGI